MSEIEQKAEEKAEEKAKEINVESIDKSMIEKQIRDFPNIPQLVVNGKQVFKKGMVIDQLGNTLPKDILDCFLEDDVKLNASFKQSISPSCFSKALLPHQRTCVSAAISIENMRTRASIDSNINRFNGRSDSNKIMISETSGALLSEMLGSGKTNILQAIITLNPTPVNRPIFQVLQHPWDMATTKPKYTNYRSLEYFPSIYIEKTFDKSLILKPTLVFAAASITKAWENNIKTLYKSNKPSVLTVVDKLGLTRLYRMIKNKQINQFDIVIVKNGKLSSTFQWDPEDYIESVNNNLSGLKIYNGVANMTRNLCWSRVIIDDCDTINLPTPTAMINSLFTWFVSSTVNVIDPLFKKIKIQPDCNVHVNLHKKLSYNYMTTLNDHTFKLFNVHNEVNYTEQSVAMGKPVSWEYRIPNINKRYIDMIGYMVNGGDVSRRIIDALNGDAIESAADLAGIKSTSISDIFKKILSDKYGQYSKSVNTIAWLDENTIDIDFESLPDPLEDDCYHQKHIYEKRPIEFNYPDLLVKIAAVRASCEQVKLECGIAIERVKENIRDGDCFICYNSLADGNAIIVNCCSKIMCSSCAVLSTAMKRGVNGSIAGKCPNCRQLVNFSDFIFINPENVDMTKILTDDNTSADNILKLDESTVKRKENITKFDILLSILNNDDTYDDYVKKIDVNMQGLMGGIGNLPVAPVEDRKFIIFSKFDESLTTLEDKLKEHKIIYRRAGGTAKQLNELFVDFQDPAGKTKILLINGEKYSSGANLQAATHLIFMHHIIEDNVRAQIAGRILRMGRKYTADIRSILYNQEGKLS
jgi:hypothetical protein